MSAHRTPQTTQAWLVGSGIASLAAAVHLIHDAGVPGPNIHVLDIHSSSGGGVQSCGDPTNGYVLYAGGLPFFHGQCVEKLLSIVPSDKEKGKSLLDVIQADAQPHDEASRQATTTTRLLKKGERGPYAVKQPALHIGPGYRLALIEIMMAREESLGARAIRDFFDDGFFRTDFWALWSATFALQPWHSVLEFRRTLCKHLADVEHLHTVHALDRSRYTVYESLVLQVTAYLQDSGVDFHFNTKVNKLRLSDADSSSSSSSPLVSEILVQDTLEPFTPKTLKLAPSDLVIITAGSTSTGAQRGSNASPPPSSIPAAPKDLLSSTEGNDWSLWLDLTHQRPRHFGDPLHFLPSPSSSVALTTLVTFTTTFLTKAASSAFLSRYSALTADSPQGTGALLPIVPSNWGLSLSIPRQPVAPTQPPDSLVIWGYALRPWEKGNFTAQPMVSCSGCQITAEIVAHLGLGSYADLEPRQVEAQELILAWSITVPMVVPLATAPVVSRERGKRPGFLSEEGVKNLLLVGEFVEVGGEEVGLGMEYQVRSARVAVEKAMGLGGGVPQVEREKLLAVLEMLGE